MRFLACLIFIISILISSCHHQETLKGGGVRDEKNDASALNTHGQSIFNESRAEQECACRPNPYTGDVENDSNIFRKIENGDTDAFELYYNYSTYTYKREDVLKVLEYSLLLAEKYHYVYGYNRASESYVMLYEIDGHLSDVDKNKLVSYCWKSYHLYNDLAAIYRLRNIYRGDLGPSLQDSNQYKRCDSIINFWKERSRQH